MLLFGHRFIESEKFYHINDIASINNTPPSSTLFLDFSEENLDVIQHFNENDLSFVLRIQNITELIYANALNADFIAVDKDLAKSAQNIAESYLFDAKILVLSSDESDIEELALLGVDGLLCATAIIKISS